MSGPPARTGSSSMAASDAVLIASSSPAAPPPLSFSIGSPPFHSTVTTTSLSPPRPALVHSPSSAPSFATRASVDAAGNARAPPPPPGSTLPRKLGKILHLSSSSSSGTTTKSSLFPPRSADLASGFPRSSSTTLNAVGAGSVRVSEDGDGPWRISVAAEGRVSAKIVVYASTATHNYTFLRATHEIQDLHDKLTATLPPSILPVLPRIAADESTIKAPAPSRRRSFLNAFAKFSADGRGVSSTAQSTKNGLISPPQSPMLAGTPYKELGDPFNTTLSSTTSAPPSSFKHVGNPDASVSASTSVSSMSSFSGSALDIDEASSNVGSGVGPHSPMAALAEYLTVISNMPAVRKTRGWKRFTRVRGDDLISVRVERKIQRTRSAQGLNTLASSSSSGSRTGKSNSILQSTSDSCVSDDDAILIETDEEGGVADVTGTIPVASGSRAASASPQEQDMEILASVPPSPSSLGGAELPTPAPSPSAAKTLPPTPSSGSGPHTPSKTIFGAAGAADFKGSASDSQSSSHSDQISPAQTRPPPRPASADPDKSSSKVAQWAEEGAKRKLAVAATRRKPKVTIEDFELIRVLGRGCAGKVLLVRQKNGENRGLLAMKSIVKRHVLAHQELQHTLTEQAVLKRMSRDLSHPFIVHLHHSFHDKENLFLVMDFHPGGDLATQLARWGRFGRDRARFYAAEIVEGVQGLHAAGVIYRDLKPENILLDQAGHLVLTDFGLSKEFPRKALSSPLVTLSDGSVAHFDLDPLPIEPGSSMTDQARRDWSPLGSRTTDTTSTFCGTAEYLAPEVIQGLPYSYEVDWWSLGTMLYEMLIGVTPFWASNHTDMYTRVLHDDLVFPTDRPVDQDTKSLIRGLLQRNPALRLGEPRLKKHPYFSMIDWDHVYHKRYIPPYTPPTDPNNEMDTQNFDEAFLGMEPTVGADPEGHGDGLGLAAATSLGVVPTPTAERMEDGRCVSLFDGYSYRENDTLSIMEEDDDELVPGSPRRQHQHRQEKSDGTMAEGSTEVEDARLAELIASEAELVTVLAGGNYPEVLDTAVGEQREREEEEASSASSTTTAEDTSSSDALSSPVLARQPPLGHRSGIPALDKGLPSDLDTEDDDEDDEDEDWDLVEAPVHKGHIALNGGSRTLFARGVVDRYKLGVLKRKESRAIITPSTHQPSSQPGSSLGTPSKGDVSHTLASSTTTTRRGLPFTPSRFRVRPKPIVSALSSSNATTTVVKPPSPSLSSTGERSPTKPSGVPINSGRVPSASSSSSVSAEEDSAGGGFGGMGTARRRDRKKFGGAETFRDLFGRGHSGPGSP